MDPTVSMPTISAKASAVAEDTGIDPVTIIQLIMTILQSLIGPLGQICPTPKPPPANLRTLGFLRLKIFGFDLRHGMEWDQMTRSKLASSIARHVATCSEEEWHKAKAEAA